MVATNKFQIKKETASVKHYTDKNGYVTKRINLNARSHFADNEKVVIISESDFEKYYQETASLDDFTENPMDEIESEIQRLENECVNLKSEKEKFENDLIDSLKEIYKIQEDSQKTEREYVSQLRDMESRLNIEKSKHSETLSSLRNAIDKNNQNNEVYMSSLDNILLITEKVIRNTIDDSVKQTTDYNNAELSKMGFFRRLKKITLTTPRIEDDREIFEPSFSKIKEAVNSNFKKIE